MCRNMIPRWFTSGRVRTRSSWRLSSASAWGSESGRCWWTTGPGDGADGDGIGDRGVSTTTIPFGVDGTILIGRRAHGIVRGRLCGPTVRAIAATGATVREIIARLILLIIVLATIVRLTDRVTRQVTTGREIVPVAIARHLNHPGPLHPGRRVNRIGRVDHRSRPGRNSRARASLRSLVKRDRHVRINLVPQGLRLSQSLEVRAAHRRSLESVNN